MPTEETQKVEDPRQPAVADPKVVKTLRAELAKQTNRLKAIRLTLKVPDGASDDEIFAALDRTKQEAEDTVQAKWSLALSVEKKATEAALKSGGELDQKVAYLEDRVKELEAREISTTGNVVVLDGEPYKIEVRERMWELVQHWKKHFVEDDAVALVVKKV